ncbi:MAG TPA: DUF4259 domain-containing protein [Terriglobales bacterium]|nr:DUF4259 domain-containing protein [Terriglobales bacterium]
MGAWGSGILDNDTAQDFIAAVVDENDLSTIEEAIARVLRSGTDYLEAPEAEEAIAAVNIIARILGRDPEEPEDADEVDEWITRCEVEPDDVLVEEARKALDRVLTEPSELLEQWQESDDGEAWERNVRALQQSL